MGRHSLIYTCPEAVTNYMCSERVGTSINVCPEWVTNYTCLEVVVYQETNEWYPMRDKYISRGSPRPARRVYIYESRPPLYYCDGGVYITIYIYIYLYNAPDLMLFYSGSDVFFTFCG